MTQEILIETVPCVVPPSTLVLNSEGGTVTLVDAEVDLGDGTEVTLSVE